MSIRHLDSMFDPRSVAVFGASERAGSVGATVWRNLRQGGYAGACWPVNSRRQRIDGQPVYSDIASLPEAPELAVICTPPASVPGLIDALGARGTRAAVVLSAGFDAPSRQAMLDAARKHLLRIIGPNCLGLLSPHARLNASFAHVGAQPGSLAFVSQSGALVTAVLDWANGRGIGFSHCISLGEHADVDFGDLIDWLATDARTRSILLYVESLSAARKFMSAARAAARNKPVLVVKAGRSALGQAAAASHTGALAGSDLVYDAAFRRAGMLRVDTLADLFVAAETLAHFRGLPSEADAEWLERLTLVTNGGGAGVLAADAAALAGVALAPLTSSVSQALNAALPANWSHANPVDIIGDAPVERYVHTLQALLGEQASGTLLFMHAPTAIVPSGEIAEALVPVVQAAPGRLLSCWLGDAAVQGARSRFRAAGIPCYDMPEEAVRAFSMLVTYRRNQQQLLEAPPARRAHAPFDAAQVHALVDAVLADGREMFSEPEAKALLAAAGVPVVGTRVVEASAEAAVRAAREIGYPVVLKLLSPQVSHKSDVGGVALDLENDAALRDAASAMLLRVASLRPDASVTGFTLQAMVRRPQALELIVGASVDPLFGPVILFGQGGTAVEVVADRAIALPPLSVPLARALISRTRVARLLAGWRDVPAADLDAVVAALQAVGELLAIEPRISEIDINPLLADAKGVIALDARVRVSTAATGGAAHFAILPYPAELAETWDWQGRTLTVRPIRPEDEAQHLAFLAQLDPLDLRMRVFYSRRTIEHSELARLTQIDYGREMAFIATAPTPSGGEETLAVVRALSDPDNHDAEFGILVRSDLKGGGLGERLMHKLIDYLRAQGTQRIVATVLADNDRMLQLAKVLGFVFDQERAEAGVRSIHLDLQ
ncbi:MAG: bifunctional acetate--CoA ligase family protein/GNAT family N-acetyltransferase [Burkholderiaceae bacterium]